MSDAGNSLSRAERFRLKAGQCRKVARVADLPQTRVIFTNLARSYGRLATHEERLEAAIRGADDPSLRHRGPPFDSEPPGDRRFHVTLATKVRKRRPSVSGFLASAGGVLRQWFSASDGRSDQIVIAKTLRAAIDREMSAQAVHFPRSAAPSKN
jgi:hypothetical protein